ncbi:MAG: hypothetical protein K1W30_16430 [Lachnospiraceae bacterium]
MYNWDKGHFIQYINDIVLPECGSGNRSCLGILQRVFAFSDEKQLQVKAAAIDEEILSGASVKELIWLSENFRSWQWDDYVTDTADGEIDFGRENFSHLSDGPGLSCLIWKVLMSESARRR